ncbi:putative membrane protein [Thioflavicoccus mobilis 8321]|uniref:Putative membrane protein n=1 Tax=Thioflavicoccus mobilis 8321 TaxID=765912 RepID=L0GUH9_9GAMM|nr:DUF599 domain-containing protein [Thioflavicoccus mobilis]AGA89656.1 putative membrane protein [Thioflavicoccus mobilis 8321]
MNDLELNLLVFAASAALILSYHLYLRARLRRDPSYTIQAVNARAREIWVHNIMSGKGKDILAVQTLRNSTMAGTFLASTAILLIMGVINLIPHGEHLTPLMKALEQHALAGDLATLKLLPFLVVFFCAFFCFTQAVRLYNHVGYLINASGAGAHSPTPALVAHVLNRSGRFYSYGMRSYYLSVPLVFWLFGPWYLLAGAVALVAVLHYVDRTPSQLLEADSEADQDDAPHAPAPDWHYARQPAANDIATGRPQPATAAGGQAHAQTALPRQFAGHPQYRVRIADPTAFGPYHA